MDDSSDVARSTWSPEALFKANDISIPVQKHLIRVYMALAATLLAAAVGVGLEVTCGLVGKTTVWAMHGLFFGLYCVDKRRVTMRLGMLIFLAACMGVNIGPIVATALHVDPAIVVTALLATTATFLCFTVSAVIEKRRSYLYLMAFVSSAVVMLALVLLVSPFSDSIAAYNTQLYTGLLAFCAYVLVDTQMIIEKASVGDDDVVLHALELFLDFVNIFVRLVDLLLRKEE